MPRILALALLILFHLLTAHGYPRSTMRFLTFPSSAITNGYGGVFLPSAPGDPLSPILNPAALGLMSQTMRLSAAFYPEKTLWGPELYFLPRGIHYSSRALNVGVDSRRLGKWIGRDTRFSLGVGYNEILLDYGETKRRGPNNEDLGSTHPKERMNGVSFGIGYENRLKAAAGFSFKYVTSDLGFSYELQREVKASVFSHDLGFALQVPLMEYWPRVRPIGRSSFVPYVTPALSYAVADLGASVDYGEPGRADPLPRTEHLAFALSTGLAFVESDEQPWTLISLEAGVQAEDELITNEADYRYQYPLTDINLIRDFVIGKANDRILKRRGAEIGLLDFFYLRFGSVEATGEEHRYRSRGFGFRLAGLLALGAHIHQPNWSNHFDLNYSETHFQNHGSYLSYDGMTYRQISLYIR